MLIPRKSLFLTKGFYECLVNHLEIGVFVLLNQVQDLAGIHLFVLGQACLYDLQAALADSLFLSRIIWNGLVWNVRLRSGFDCRIGFRQKNLRSQRLALRLGLTGIILRATRRMTASLKNIWSRRTKIGLPSIVRKYTMLYKRSRKTRGRSKL